MSWIRALFHRNRLQDELDDEVRLHVELQAEEYVRAGMSPEEARSAAERRLGNATKVRERCRDENGVNGVETFWQDLRFGVRTLVSQRGFSAVVLLTLAFGIGANTAMFSVLRGILFEPLPLPEPDRVAVVWEYDRLRGTIRERASYPDYRDLKEQSRVFEHLAAMQNMNATLTGVGEAERVPAARVTANYFSVLGLQPSAGRAFGKGEEGLVLSHALWQRKFKGDLTILGSTLNLDGRSGIIVGIMPPEAALTAGEVELWSSLENLSPQQFRGQHNTYVIGRLRRGVRQEQAQAEMTTIMARLEKQYGDDNLGRGATVVPLHEDLAGTMRPALKVLAAAVAGVLLIACFNIASLLLARASARRREMAIRTSLGAGRLRLARQLLTESLVLALGGGVLGVAVAYWMLHGLVGLELANMPLLERVRLDSAALVATAAIALAAWIAFGLLPAWQVASANPAGALHASGRSSTGGRESHRLLHGLVMAEVAMAVVLVISAGLLLRSFWKMRHVDLGYQPSGMITLRVSLPEARFPYPQFPFREWPAAIGFYDRVKSETLSIPGVQSVSWGLASPARPMFTTRTYVEGRPVPPEGEQKEAQFRTADPDYLRTAGVELRRGRFFAESDDSRHPLVTVLNEAFVREHFPGEEAVGRQIKVFGLSRQVIGVIGDLRYAGPGAAPSPAMYFPVRQQPFPDVTLMARTSGDPNRIANTLRKIVSDIEPSIAAFDVMTVESAIAGATARERLVLTLLSGFGALAMALAIVGIYGVVSYAVGRRRREIAVRIALGAGRSKIFTQVTGAMVGRALVGVVAGLGITIAVAPSMQPLVFETSPRDVSTYSAVAAVLLCAAFLGAALPARRAARLDPAITLREE